MVKIIRKLLPSGAYSTRNWAKFILRIPAIVTQNIKKRKGARLFEFIDTFIILGAIVAVCAYTTVRCVHVGDNTVSREEQFLR